MNYGCLLFYKMGNGVLSRYLNFFFMAQINALIMNTGAHPRSAGSRHLWSKRSEKVKVMAKKAHFGCRFELIVIDLCMRDDTAVTMGSIQRI